MSTRKLNALLLLLGLSLPAMAQSVDYTLLSPSAKKADLISRKSLQTTIACACRKLKEEARK